MNTNPYLVIKKGEEAQAIFVSQIVTFEKTSDGETYVELAGGETRTLDIDFDSFCRMINQATEAGSIVTHTPPAPTHQSNHAASGADD